MTRTTPELAPPLQTSTPHQQEDVWPLRMIWRATWRIFSGIGFRTWNPPTPKPRSLPLSRHDLAAEIRRLECDRFENQFLPKSTLFADLVHV
ncbi:hypothetical protein AVEN_220180-1 [Araneus ventricosus]|uniref:Uncharacterized protein n=1 Tax=Araneus ventricosus TaxID=182803 RepID=A0A4Y2RIF0_ARAVE|nr:hypothetical protein AVEN_152444-1 [Araneus ventricosus]GBN75592.1 hypothetical protein AVEN_220180-1 [Araneus ventricosus]